MAAHLEDRPLLKDLKHDALVSMGAGLIATACVALGLAAFLDLSPAHGFVAAILYVGYMWVAWTWLPDHAPHRTLGPANRITIFRAALVANIGMITLEPSTAPAHGWLVTSFAIVTFALDGVDGAVARKHAVASRFGARFDAELDAALTLLLAVLVFRMGRAEGFVLLAGAWRYIFLGLMYVLPALHAELPYSQRRRLICGVQIGTLIACLSPLLPTLTAIWLANISVALLSMSFMIDIIWLLRKR